MRPFLIIKLDEVWDPPFGICQGLVFPKIDLFRLQSLEKALQQFPK
jgi:hypothetical protein